MARTWDTGIEMDLHPVDESPNRSMFDVET